MNARGASLLANPHPCGHIVYPYTDEGLVGQAVCLFASAGLRDGDGVILIMSADHCESIKIRLQLEGLNTESYERSGQLICVIAEDLLAKFVPDKVLDEALFKSTIGGLINQVRAGLPNEQSAKVRVFGEMVSQLYSNKDLTATTRLEELWNEVIEEHSVALLCTYALDHASDRLPEALIQLHSESIERELSAVKKA
jgi:MEDS: MEthanogen/methylotroph, DcmR Sensory domain